MIQLHYYEYGSEIESQYCKNLLYIVINQNMVLTLLTILGLVLFMMNAALFNFFRLRSSLHPVDIVF